MKNLKKPKMDNQNMHGSLVPDPNASFVTLPVTNEAFRDYITSLLGQPESVEGYLEGAFEINSGHIDHLSNLIEDRIKKQNDASFLQFTAKLFFSDDSSLSFNSIFEFLKYEEHRPITCESFTFTWSYLVTFHDKKFPERQELLLSTYAK